MWQRSTSKQLPGVIGGPRLETRERHGSLQILTRRNALLRLLRYTSAIKDFGSNMSTKAKATLAGTILGTIGIVYFVHYQQVADKAVSQHLATPSRASC